MLNGKIVKLIWQDIYTEKNTTLYNVIEDLGKACVDYSYGEIVFENKKFIILLQNECGEKSDYIVIPKSVVLKRTVYAEKK